MTVADLPDLDTETIAAFQATPCAVVGCRDFEHYVGTGTASDPEDPRWFAACGACDWAEDGLSVPCLAPVPTWMIDLGAIAAAAEHNAEHHVDILALAGLASRGGCTCATDGQRHSHYREPPYSCARCRCRAFTPRVSA